MTHLAHRHVDVALLVTLVRLTFSRVLVIPTTMKLCVWGGCVCVCVWVDGCVCVCGVGVYVSVCVVSVQTAAQQHTKPAQQFCLQS